MAEPLKSRIDDDVVARYADAFTAAPGPFDRATFLSRTSSLGELELKERVGLVADALRASLPSDDADALAAVVHVGDHSGLDGIAAWPLCAFVERHGLADPASSLAAMERLTRHFSCEFAIRPFLEHHLELSRRSCRRWTRSPSADVRRLPSEGTRPYLPWAKRIRALLDDPSIGLEFVTALRHDPDAVVRRSVANHLNDVARDHPDLVVSICRDWSTDPAIDDTMIRHALRVLVKDGHRGAMDVLGYTTDPDVGVESFTVTPPEVRLGDSIELRAGIVSRSHEPQRLVVDYVIHHVKAGGATSPKVFKWSDLELAPGQSADLVKRRTIATASTRRYHRGVHRVDLQVAGDVVATTEFALSDSS